MKLEDYRALSRADHPDTEQLIRTQVVDPLKSAKNADDALQILLTASRTIEQMRCEQGSTRYLYRGYEIRLFFQNDVPAKIATALARIAELGLLCAPDLVDFIQFPGFGSVVITYLRGLDYDGRLVPIRMVPHESEYARLSVEACDALRTDMDKLADCGYVIPSVLVESHWWSLHPHTGHLIIHTMAWAEMRAIELEERGQIGHMLDLLMALEAA